jgi:hypothetical protein
MADPTTYSIAISHLERARTSARLARETTGTARATHEADEKRYREAAIREISNV